MRWYRTGGDVSLLKPLISESLQDIAKGSRLQSYEIPRDFLIETTPFTLENGLLTGIRKLARPKLKEHYGDRLEQLYAELADSQANELRVLRQSGADRPVLETVSRAAAALLGAAVQRAASRRALHRPGRRLAVGVDVRQPAARDLRHRSAGGRHRQPGQRPAVDRRLHRGRAQSGAKRPTFATVHGRCTMRESTRCTPVISRWTSSSTPRRWPPPRHCPPPSAQVRTVLLTGATGFLGRYLALEWLERMHLVGGKLICLVRAKDDAAARERLDTTFDSGDPELLRALPGTGRRSSGGHRRRQGSSRTSAWISRRGSGWPTPST